jgi:D-aminoacyl-tRNA deacylase
MAMTEWVDKREGIEQYGSPNGAAQVSSTLSEPGRPGPGDPNSAMRACIQRVSSARVIVDGETAGEIRHGLLVLLGIAADDGGAELRWMVDKVVGLRVFNDADGKMNFALSDVGGELLVVSQFTLLGDCRKGRRPSFVSAAPPEMAERMYEEFVEAARARGVRVATGRFRTHMNVELVNDGPVTLLIDSSDR